MELSKRFVLILVLAAAGVVLIANAVRGNAVDSAQGAAIATIATTAAATSTIAFITGEQGVIYFPSQYTLNAPEPTGEHIQAF